MWLWAVLWLDIAHSFGLFLLEMWIKITWTLQGCQELNVIRPSGTPPKAARSFDGKWKPKFHLTFVAKYWICVSDTVKKTWFLTVSKGKIEVPAFFYYGIPPHLRVLLRAQNAQSLQFFKLLLSLGKGLRNHFFGSIPMHIELAIFFCFVFWMVFSSTWSVCSVLQLAGYYFTACCCANDNHCHFSSKIKGKVLLETCFFLHSRPYTGTRKGSDVKI